MLCCFHALSLLQGRACHACMQVHRNCKHQLLAFLASLQKAIGIHFCITVLCW